MNSATTFNYFLRLPTEIRFGIYLLLLEAPLLRWRDVTPEWPNELVSSLLPCRHFNPVFQRTGPRSQGQCLAVGTTYRGNCEEHPSADLRERWSVDNAVIDGNPALQSRLDPLRDEVSFHILLTCKQISEEAAIPFYYRVAILCFEMPLHFANDFLRHLEPSNIGRLQNLRLDFHLPGKTQVWQRQPAPTLSRFRHLLTMF